MGELRVRCRGSGHGDLEAGPLLLPRGRRHRRRPPYPLTSRAQTRSGAPCIRALVSAHPDTPNDVPPHNVDLDAVTPVIAALGLPFITVDLALRADGVWRIIEIGDGQVSDRPATTEPSTLITARLAGTT
ncbi:ATP-grasp domain-containing protein [Micromonospora sediminimaris]|uniref:ATP-grasp domain-containing protein n=1 Tax=Micromonospora sediminimaris TaxID=547162 RepID=UPI00378BC9B4